MDSPSNSKDFRSLRTPGVWWNTEEPDRRLKGYLEFGPDGTPELHVFDGFETRPTSIVGVSTLGKWTLVGPFAPGRESYYSDELRVVVYSATFALKSLTLPESPPERFDWAFLYFPEIVNCFLWYPFGEEWSEDRSSLQVQWKKRPDVEAETSIGTVVLSSRPSARSEHRGHREFRESPCFEVRLHEPMSLKELVREVVTPLDAFLCFIGRGPATLEHYEVGVSNGYSATVASYSRAAASSERDRVPLLFLSDPSLDLGKVVSGWFGLVDHARSTLLVYRSWLRDRAAYTTEHAFLILASCVESLHRSLVRGKKTNLENRLKALLRPYLKVFGITENEASKWASDVRKVRDLVAHNNDVFDGEMKTQSFEKSVQLQALLEVWLLDALQVPSAHEKAIGSSYGEVFKSSFFLHYD